MALKNKSLSRDNAVKVAEAAAAEARNKLEKLEQHLDKNLKELSSEVKDSIKRNINSFNEHLNLAKDEVVKAKKLAGSSEHYWKKVCKSFPNFISFLYFSFRLKLLATTL